MGSILGILKEKDGQVAISNIIFEKMLSDIVFSKIERSGMIEIPEKSQFVSDGNSTWLIYLDARNAEKG